MGKTDEEVTTPAALVSIANAAHVSGDRNLERAAKRLLRDRHGIEITFRRPIALTREGGQEGVSR